MSDHRGLPDELRDPGGAMPADQALDLECRRRAWVGTGQVMSADQARTWLRETVGREEAAVG